MSEEPIEAPLFFEFQQSPVRGIPLQVGQHKLSLGFVEVGCRSGGKRGQLRSKRKLFREYWEQEYAPRLGIDWMPKIYRMAAHFEQDYELSLSFPEEYLCSEDDDDCSLDSALRYDNISSRFMDTFDQRDVGYLLWCVRASNLSKRSELRREMKQLFDRNDGDGLFEVITNRRGDPHLAYFRGMLAERVVRADMQVSLPSGMSLYQNGEIRHVNDRFGNGAEIDGILTFYTEENYIELVQNLDALPHLTVAHRWQGE